MMFLTSIITTWLFVAATLQEKTDDPLALSGPMVFQGTINHSDFTQKFTGGRVKFSGGGRTRCMQRNFNTFACLTAGPAQISVRSNGHDKKFEVAAGDLKLCYVSVLATGCDSSEIELPLIRYKNAQTQPEFSIDDEEVHDKIQSVIGQGTVFMGGDEYKKLSSQIDGHEVISAHSIPHNQIKIYRDRKAEEKNNKKRQFLRLDTECISNLSNIACGIVGPAKVLIAIDFSITEIYQTVDENVQTILYDIPEGHFSLCYTGKSASFCD